MITQFNDAAFLNKAQMLLASGGNFDEVEEFVSSELMDYVVNLKGPFLPVHAEITTAISDIFIKILKDTPKEERVNRLLGGLHDISYLGENMPERLELEGSKKLANTITSEYMNVFTNAANRGLFRIGASDLLVLIRYASQIEHVETILDFGNRLVGRRDSVDDPYNFYKSAFSVCQILEALYGFQSSMPTQFMPLESRAIRFYERAGQYVQDMVIGLVHAEQDKSIGHAQIIIDVFEQLGAPESPVSLALAQCKKYISELKPDIVFGRFADGKEERTGRWKSYFGQHFLSP
jgi:hypothetical protein